MSLTASFRLFALFFRIPNSFTVISNVLTAYLLAVNAQYFHGEVLLLVAASLLFYHGGIAMNDCVDVAEDRRMQPNRPLASGAIELKLAWLLAIGMMLFGLLVLVPFGIQTLMWGGAVVALICAYNFSSRDGLIGCVLMGMCRGANYLLVLTAMGAATSLWPVALLVTIYVMSLTFLSRDEEYAKRPWLAYLCLLMMALVGGGFIFKQFSESTVDNFIGVFIMATLLAYALLEIVLLLRDYRPEKIRGMVKFFILGMIPLDACLLLVAGFDLAAVCILLLILPSRYLAKSLYVT